MKERDKAVVVSKVNAFLTSIKDLSTIDKTSLVSKIKLSLKETPNYIEKDMCPFDSTLGDALDLVADCCNKSGLTHTTENFGDLVEKHIKNKSFMSAKKILTHVNEFNNNILKSRSMLKNLFAYLIKSRHENEVKEALRKVSHEYLEVVIDLLKLEKYRLTEKLTVKDEDIVYSSETKPDSIGTTREMWESIIKDITSKDFIPRESDITQGDIGDCYLLTALKNIVRSDPNIIKKCFVANKEDGIILRFYKVVAEFKEENGKIMLESKAAGRVMIKMDKTILLDKSKGLKGVVFGNRPTYALSIWVNLIEKAYAIYISKNNITGKNFNFQEFMAIIKSSKVQNIAQKNNLAEVEEGIINIATTAITGKKGIGFLPSIAEQQPSSITSGSATGNSTSQSQPTEIQVKSQINPSTIVGIIKKEIAEGKAVSISSYPPNNPCWKAPLLYNNKYIDAKNLAASHAFSVKGIEKVGNTDYIVLSDPHMFPNGVMITGDKITAYGSKGDIYLTTENLSKYFCAYYINKLKKGKRG